MEKITRYFKNNKTIRWIAVIPTSLILGFLATFPLHWVLYVILSGELFSNGLGLLMPIEHFLTPILTMFVYILMGYKIAPKYKFQTSVVMAILWVVFALYITIFIPEISNLDIRVLFTFLGILSALYFNWNKSKNINETIK